MMQSSFSDIKNQLCGVICNYRILFVVESIVVFTDLQQSLNFSSKMLFFSHLLSKQLHEIFP